MIAIKKIGIFYLALIVLGVGYTIHSALGAATAGPASTNGAVTVSSNPSGETRTYTGWFTTIWNGKPRYSITDEQGRHYRLLLDDATARSLGGALQFDRRRVSVTGKMVENSDVDIEVASIRLVPES